MKVLMISRDEDVFVKHSQTRKRMEGYSHLFDELHIIVFSKKYKGKEQIGTFAWAYGTGSKSKLLFALDAYRLGSHIPSVDIISTQDPFETAISGILLARKRTIPVQIQVHVDFLSESYRRQSFSNKLRAKVGEWALKRAFLVRVVSQKIKESIEKKWPNPKRKISVLPIFVDMKKIKETNPSLDLKKNHPRFSYIALVVGRLTKEKNIGLALRAFRSVVKSFPKAGLLIVGRGPEEAFLKKEVRRLSIADNVIFLPWTEDIISYYKNSDVVLVPSLYEGFGRTIVEALLSGTPVVATDVGVAKESGAIITNGTENDLAKKIEDVFLYHPKGVFHGAMINSFDEYLHAYKALLLTPQ
jgi:glycosyltransferase involved in cell wall biosynthesis